MEPPFKVEPISFGVIGMSSDKLPLPLGTLPRPQPFRYLTRHLGLEPSEFCEPPLILRPPELAVVFNVYEFETDSKIISALYCTPLRERL